MPTSLVKRDGLLIFNEFLLLSNKTMYGTKKNKNSP